MTVSALEFFLTVEPRPDERRFCSALEFAVVVNERAMQRIDNALHREGAAHRGCDSKFESMSHNSCAAGV
jgi:hypothetical protein